MKGKRCATRGSRGERDAKGQKHYGGPAVFAHFAEGSGLACLAAEATTSGNGSASVRFRYSPKVRAGALATNELPDICWPACGLATYCQAASGRRTDPPNSLWLRTSSTTIN